MTELPSDHGIGVTLLNRQFAWTVVLVRVESVPQSSSARVARLWRNWMAVARA